MMPYSILYADPNWVFDTYSEKGQTRGAVLQYDTSPTAVIASLPVIHIADKNSILFMWVNGPRLFDAEIVMDAWGFKYKSIAFVWVKLTKDGQGFPIGNGYWTRQNPEICVYGYHKEYYIEDDADICLLGTRGQPKRIDASVPTLVLAPRGKHSQKPAIVRDKIVQLVGDLPRIELFATERVTGWDAYGNEIEYSDIEFEGIPIPPPKISNRK